MQTQYISIEIMANYLLLVAIAQTFDCLEVDCILQSLFLVLLFLFFTATFFTAAV